MMLQIRQTTPEKLISFVPRYSDARLSEMLFRYRARNYPDTLTADEWQKWRDFCVAQFTNVEAGGSILLNDYLQRIQTLQENGADGLIIQALRDYAREKMYHLEI